MAKIYVAASWRNERQPPLVEMLRSDGHEVYDFRNPTEGNTGFNWKEINPNWQNWTPKEYRDKLNHSVADAGFKIDMEAMKWADVFIGLPPFGRSAPLEMGWAAGRGKKTILLLDNGEPELMVKMLDHICVFYDEVKKVLKSCDPLKK